MNVVSKLISAIITAVLTVSTAASPLPAPVRDSLSHTGIPAERLNELNCSQLVLVESQGCNGCLSFYEKDDNGCWSCNDGMCSSCWVGKNGVGKASEGVPTTPRGLYAIGSAFYRDSKPSTKLNAFAVTPDTYWVDDSSSKNYNKRVVGNADRDWNSAENMYTSEYRYGFVIEYNTGNPVPGKGSAFFFHVYGKPTDGCVGADVSTVLSYLQALDASKNPYILIV